MKEDYQRKRVVKVLKTDLEKVLSEFNGEVVTNKLYSEFVKKSFEKQNLECPLVYVKGEIVFFNK